MAMWLYQMSAREWSPNGYRLDIWEGERWRWEVGEIVGGGPPAYGDSAVFFFTETGCREPGFYGWAIIQQWEERNDEQTRGRRFMSFRPVTPSDQLKIHPWGDGEAQRLVTAIRAGRAPNSGTLWPVEAHLAAEIATGIARWVRGESGTQRGAPVAGPQPNS